MKNINKYISEKLVIGNNLEGYNYFPKDKGELIECIKDKISKEGYGTEDKPLNLNDIDTSEITDMSNLFNAYHSLGELSSNRGGYFDISKWDVSKVKNMREMFMLSYFNGNISNWDVSSVENMNRMFSHSKFDGNISNWDVSRVKTMYAMFYSSSFNGNLSKWNVNNVDDMQFLFTNCPLQKNPPKWYKE